MVGSFRHSTLNNDQKIFLIPADCRFEMRISSLACAGRSGARCKAGGGVGLEDWRTQSVINVETQSANNSRKCHGLASRGRSRSRLGYLWTRGYLCFIFHADLWSPILPTLTRTRAASMPQHCFRRGTEVGKYRVDSYSGHNRYEALRISMLKRPSLMIFVSASQLHVYLPRLGARLA